MTSKKIPIQHQILSIDVKHDQMLEYFNHLEDTVIPNLESEKQNIKDCIRKLQNHEIDKYMDLKDKLKEISSKIKKHKNEKKNYFLENSKIIFNYFEEKQQINNTNEVKKNSKAMHSFFKIKKSNQTVEELDDEKYNESKKMYKKYWKNMNQDNLQVTDFTINCDTCEICNIGEMIAQEDEGIMICNNSECGNYIIHIVDSNKPTNKEPPNEVSYTAYIRLNHFKEILAQFQAKETTQIPDEVIDAIKKRIKKERIEDLRELNYNKMRDILRKLNLNKYFEHIQYINSLFGIKPPLMNEELHETLCVLFIEIQRPWALHCPPNRTNFFNYTYTLYQLCVLLDQTQYLPFIPMMKDRDKQLEQDMIWKEVCKELDWQFFPTV
jgi:hypothetical protein